VVTDLIEGKKKNSNFSLRLPKDVRKKLQVLADKEGVKPAFIVRRAIENYFQSIERVTHASP
jgi:predicted DNA-binding protein